MLSEEHAVVHGTTKPLRVGDLVRASQPTSAGGQPDE